MNCTFKLYRGYFSNDVKFKPTTALIRQANDIYSSILSLSEKDKLVLTTKKYKRLDKVITIIENEYFPFYDLDMSMTDGDYIEYVIRGKQVKKALEQNRLIKALVEQTIKDIGITTETSQTDAVKLINDYFVANYKYEMYGYNANSTYDKLLMVKKTGICQDYSYAFYLLATFCGIKTGMAFCHKGVGHAFNCTRIDGVTWYHDTCWNNKIESKYLFMRKKEFESTSDYHKINYVKW